MSTNNVNIVNTNNWYQKMNTNGNQNVTNMVLSGTNPSTQMALISVANDVHYLSSNYQLSKTNGFTLTFQFYITGTIMNSICAYFGVTDPTTNFDANGGLANQSGAVELMIRPAGGSGGQSIFNLYTNYGSNAIAATNGTSVTTGTWQTVTITYTPSVTGTWVVNYNGTNIISYNDSSYTTFASNQNTVWGIYGATGGSSGASIRSVDLSVKQSMPMSVLKNTYSFYPEECFINKLSTYSQNNVGAAFGLRLLKADYLGPIINIRRGSDNATLDFYADSKGNIGTTLYGTGMTLLGWLAGSIGYVTRWYDQSGNGRDVINTTTTAQPKIGTPILDSLSSSGKSAARGIYTLYSANSSYFGPTIKLRRSSDNAVSDFYADVYGNLTNWIGSTLYSYPIYPMTSDTSVLSDGTYISSYSSTSSGGGEVGYLAFNNNTSDVYTCAVNNYVRATGAYSGSSTTIMSSTTYSGEWLQLKTPNSIVLTQYTLTSHSGGSQWGRSPVTFYLGGSNDGSNWVLLDRQSNLSWSQTVQTSKTFTINNTNAYSYYRIICNSVVGTDSGGLHTTNAYWSVAELTLNSYNSTLTSFSSWIGSSTAYVDTWYDQSGSGNHATQSTTSFQPVYNYTLKLIDSQNSSTQFLNMPSGTVPTGTANAPYSFVFRHGTFNNTNGAFIGAGAWSNNQSNVIRLFSGQPNGYSNYWYNNDLNFGTNTAVTGNTIAITYTGTVHNAYVNGTLSNTNSNHTGGTTASGQQYLFRVVGGEYLNGQMYSVYIFGSALSDSDRMACTANPTDLNIKYDGSASYLYNGTTNLPLSSGLKTYTYIFSGRPDNNTVGNATIDQWTTGQTSNTRAGLIFYIGGFGFVGQNNDNLSMISYSSFVNRKVVMMCNHNLSSNNITINDNGSIYNGSTNGTISSLSVGTDAFAIGRGSTRNSEYFVGNINEVIVFRNTLTAKESDLYFTPNAITRKMYRSTPRIQIKDVPKDINPIPIGAIVTLDTQMLLNMSPGGLVTSWNGSTGYNSPVINAGISGTGIAFIIPPYVSIINDPTLVSATTGQYLDAGSKTFNVNSGGGFTAVWYGAFTNTTATNAYERIFDFGNGQNVDNIIALRPATGTTMAFCMQNGGTQYSITTGSNAIVQNEWAVWSFRYTASNRSMEIIKNGFPIVIGTAGAAITDKTLTKTWIGRGQWTAATTDYYSNINTAGLYVYTSFLTDAQIASVSNHLMYSNYTSLPSVLPDYNNKVIRYGSILSQGYKDGQAMYFSGRDTGSYLDIQDVPNCPLTFSFWFYNINSSGATYISPAALCSADLAGWGIQFDMINSGTTIAAAYHNGSNYTQFTNSTVALNTWYHIAFVVTPTTAAYYLNGSLVQSVSAVIYNTNRLIIGKSGDNARPFNGYIADIRVYDYALSADEIGNGVANTAAGRYLLNYNTPANYLVNVSNWYTILNTYQTGSFAATNSINDPDKSVRLTSNTAANSSNTLFNSTKIQNYNSFTCCFSAYTDTVTDHGYYFYCGATSSTTVPTGVAGTAANSSYYIYFQITGTKGIYLFNDQGQQLAYSPLPPSITGAVYVPITINYNRSVKNTWIVNVASQDLLTYNDPNNTNWVSNIAGDFWGIGARTTTSAMNCYIRRVELSYTPFTNTTNTTVNAQNNTKFPPGAMTAASTTFTGTSILDGVYTATASNSNGGINPYSAFDNNTSTFWGELVTYNSSGVYTGGIGTAVTNLVTNTTTSYTGEWIQIQVPNPLTLNSFSLMGRQDQSLYTWRTPNTFYIAGSNDGSTWQLVHSTSGAQYTLAMQYFTCNCSNNNKYRYFRIIVNKIGNNGPGGDPSGGNFLDIAAWDLYTQMNTVNAGVVAVPPYSMTANTTTFAGNSVYDGTYILTASSAHSHPTIGPIYTIFNDTYGSPGNVSTTGNNYNSSTGVYTGSTSTTVSGVSQSGDWIQIQIPNPIVLYSFSLNFWWDDQAYWAKSFLIAASNDAITWTNIYDTTTASFVYSTAQTFVVTGSPNAYRYFRLIVRATSGVQSCDWWILDQWKLYTNQSNFNLIKFPPAPLTADSPVTFTTVNHKNWYNVMSIGTTSSYSPVLSGTDPLKQLQLTPGSSGNVGTYCNVTGQPVMNYNSFTFSFQLYCQNTGNGDWIGLYFGSGGYQVEFHFEIYYYAGIRLSTSSVGNAVSSATNWYNSAWNDIRVVYNKGPTNTWTLFFNETQVIQYSDPNWQSSQPGSQWGFDTFNGAATFSSIIRQLEMTIAPQTLPGTSVVSGNYTASASSSYLFGMPSYAFNDSLKNTSNVTYWHTAMVNSAGTYTNGAYTGNTYTTIVSGTSYAGEWLQLQAPNALQLTSFGIYPRQDQSLFQRRSPRNFVMAGSNDGSTWYLLHTATGISDWTASEKYFVCNGTSVGNKYSYFRLVVTSVGNPNPGTGDFVNIQNLNLYTPITLNNSITPATPKRLLDGLTWKYFNGYSSTVVSYYTTNTYTNIGRSVDTTNFTKITNGQIVENSAVYLFSMEIFGYFRATVSGTWTFSLSSDDGSYFWIGQNALVGYTYSNYNIGTPAPNTAATCTVTLLAGTYYPIRIHYTKNNLRNANLTFSFTPPGGTQTYNGQGYFFSGTGLDSAFPQESAKIIKDLTGTNTDGVYYILVNGISTPIHCLMNDCYDGGGWMMLMKGTRGTTFQYSSNYWTSKNTLNAGDLTRSDADAKYDTFNYSTVKDVLAIWPDISPTSYTNVYGKNGGSIFVNDGWTWMINNWNETTRLTPFTGFNTTRLPHQNSASLFSTYGINNPFRYNGFGDWCSTETGSYQHVFYSTGNNANVRWGFLFNNESNDFSSCDVFCGIGMGSLANYSAGDYTNGIYTTIGINRSARFEMYGR